MGLLSKQGEQQSQDDADENAGDDGEVKRKILFSDEDVSGKPADPGNLLAYQKKQTNKNNNSPQKNEHFP